MLAEKLLTNERINISGKSQPSGGDDRLPEEHTNKRNHNNPKDKGLACRDHRPCRRGRSASRDRSCETTPTPASEPTSPDIDKDFLNLSLSCRCSQDAGRRLRPADRRAVHCRRARLVATTAMPMS